MKAPGKKSNFFEDKGLYLKYMWWGQLRAPSVSLPGISHKPNAQSVFVNLWLAFMPTKPMFVTGILTAPATG